MKWRIAKEGRGRDCLCQLKKFGRESSPAKQKVAILKFTKGPASDVAFNNRSN